MIVEYYYRWVEAKYFIYCGEYNCYLVDSIRVKNESCWIVPGTIVE